MSDTIYERKDEHIKISRENNVEYVQSSGFLDVELVHNALPEIDLAKINTKQEFLGKTLDAPIMISAMTGGTKLGGEINKKLALAANEKKVAISLGSCRPMLKDESKTDTFMIKKIATDVPVIANIGAVQIKEYEFEKIDTMISKLEVDALTVHLNPLQEAIQPEGETNFISVCDSIGKLAEHISIPLIVKETGAGINGVVAKKLFNAGAKWVESSGRGGTSWSKVEYRRGGRIPGFEEWGYSSVASVVECSLVGDTIASGGIRSGIDVANAIALGAKMTGAALPFLRATDAQKEISMWNDQLKTAMFLVGAKDLVVLMHSPILVLGKSAEILSMRGIDVSSYARRHRGQLTTSDYYL